LGIVKEIEKFYARIFVYNFSLSLKLLNFIEKLYVLSKKNESLGEVWECFDVVVNSCPSLTFPEPMLLQHLFIGLNRKTRKYLNLASGGAFMHITTERAKTILLNILNDLLEEKLLEEEEISIAEPELLPETSQHLAILEPELP
jgi:hypothetical protein